jgi:hypothetical protein
MERKIIVGFALLSSAAVLFGASFMVEGVVAMVLLAVAATDGILALLLIWKGIQSSSEYMQPARSERPELALERVRKANPELLSRLGPTSAEVVELVSQRRKIDAIKRVREVLSLDLKDAKELVDLVEFSMRAG